ncbi:30S ribosome-binding factor RbfA [Algoriphagus hitonicola]|uniref:Ribosome-binding factor A n=1 Tax=Algoriphagus hitonicola TaxID=435880 RepID=A0A1I2QIP8_9BACT|nr:30S ribosome-binding factor RbfA [Algoriphagus hitonicola]SFG27503.1 ribosome-binding factor A [Algoriphagus hitonicola]
MESKRQQKHAKLLQRELGEIFQKEARHLIGRAMVTVTRVMVSPDLGVAKVYLSVLLAEPKEIYDLVNDHKKEIRLYLSKRIGKSVRIIPELAFFPDESASYAQYMDKVIGDLNIPPAPDEEDEDEEEN